MKFFMILLIVILIFLTSFNLCIYYFIEKPLGDKGLKGPTGKKGLTGEPGDIGDRGTIGDEGEKGQKGPSQGIKGMKGNIGNPGPRGVIGDQGFEGLRGDTGEEGLPGFQGDKGVNGTTGFVGRKGPSRIITNNEPIPLIAYKDKCITLKNIGKNDPLKFICPKNMAVFDFEASKISPDNDKMIIENVTCCRFGLDSIILQNKYNRIEIGSGEFGAKIATLQAKYNAIENPTNDEKKISDNLILINSMLARSDKIQKEFLYVIRLLFQLRNDEKKLIDEIKLFPKNNIIELEKYLKIE